MPRFPPHLPTGRSVELPGRGRTWVWDTGGDGPTVVLLHGWTSTAALNWGPTFGPLGQVARVLAPDLRGHGRGVRTRLFTLRDCADDVAALVEHLDAGPAVMVGYSMGGAVAQLLWRRHPEAVTGLVLCATGAHFGGRRDLAPAVTALGLGLSVAFGAVPARLRQRALVHMVESRDDDAARARWVVGEQSRSDPASLVQAAAALNRFDSTGWIGDVDVPTSVIVTTRDRTMPPERQWQLARTIPGAESFTVTWGHRACVEVPDQFVPLLRDAVASTLDRAASASRRPGEAQARRASTARAATTTAAP